MCARPFAVARSLSPREMVKVLAVAGLAGGLVFLGAPYKHGPPAPALLAAVPKKRSQALLWKDRLDAAARAAEQAWPGFHPLAQPALFSFPERIKGSFILGSTRPIAGFREDEGAEYRSIGVALGKEADAGFMWQGTRMTAIRIDYPNLPETVAALFVDTAFRDSQSRGLFAGEPPFYHLGQAEDVVLAGLEARQLAAWAKDGNREALRNFLALRAHRRAKFGRNGAEEGVERTAGAARFLAVIAAEAAAGPASARRYLSSGLIATADPRRSGPLHPELVGAALWRLLDGKEPGLSAREAPRGTSPATLALERFPMSSREASRRVAALTRGPEYARAVAVATQQEARLEQFRRGLRFAFEAQPGRRVTLATGGADLACRADTEVEFPDHSLIVAGVRECSLKKPGLTVKLSRSRLLLRPGSVEFFSGADAAFVVDGAPWRSRRGRTTFRRLTVEGKGVELSAASGALQSDGTNVAISLASKASP